MALLAAATLLVGHERALYVFFVVRTKEPLAQMFRCRSIMPVARNVDEIELLCHSLAQRYSCPCNTTIAIASTGRLGARGGYSTCAISCCV